ncbi:MAG: putative Ig domain-containing protein [Planctomycetota bacterium]
MLTLTSPPDQLFGLAAAAVDVELGFIDDDSRNDMIALDADGNVSVALNNGDDTWRQVKVSDLNIVGATGMTLGLINDDAVLDVIIQGANEIVVALGDGSGGFTRNQSLTPAGAGELSVSGSQIDVLATMLNHDSLTDIAVVIPGTDEILVYLGQPNGTFGSPLRYSSGGSTPVRVAVGDFVSSIEPDLAVAHTDGSVTFLRGDAAGGFVLQASSTVTGLGSIRGLEAADFNEDGQTDLVVTSSTAVRALINPNDPLPSNPIANGDFQLGLSNWTVTTGSVSAATGVAQLRESEDRLLTTLEQSFVIPSGVQTLSFDLVSLGLEIPTNGLADAFEVSLLDEDGQSLVPTFHVNSTSFYNAGPDSSAALATGVTQTGNTITLSLAGLTPGTVARLIFDLVGSPSGVASAVSVDNVSVSPSSSWGTTFSVINVTGPFSGVSGLATADIDGDGHWDVVVSDQTAGQLVIAYGDGAGGFTRSTYSLTTFGTGAGAVAAAPLALGDSRPDIVVAMDSSTSILSPLEYLPVVQSDIFRVPGAPGEMTELTFTWTVRDAGYNNELGFFIVDDLQARVDGLLPGATGYIQAALANAGRQVVFAASQTQGAVTRVTLPAGTLVTPYLIQNNSTGGLLRDNPTGVVTDSPLVWFLHGAANTDGHNHFIVDILPDGRVQFGVEDQTHSGDGDFNDMIFTLAAEPGHPIGDSRFSVIDDTSLSTFRYATDGLPIQQTGLAPGNTRPRDITTSLAGNKYWIIDASSWVYIYNPAGELLGSWQATGLTTPTGIATDGTDIWIVDSGSDRVRRYVGAASRLSGSQAAFSQFNLAGTNTTASGITTNGTKLWVSDEGSDRVFVYSIAGQALGNWQLATANADASGLTLNPAGGDDLWVVDRVDNKVYYYTGALSWTTGLHSATSSFNLSAANRKPEGIADPPTSIILDQLVSGTISVANEIDEYTFTVAAGQLAYFDQISLTGGTGSTVSWKLSNPSGAQVFSWPFADRDTIELVAGTYTLRVQGTQAGANYSFRVIDVPPTSSTAISLDATQSGTLGVRGEAANFTFSATAGQRLYLDAITPTAPQSGLWWELRGPTSSVVVSNRAFLDVDTIVLPSTGTYTLRLYTTVASLSYSFRVVDVPSISSTAISFDTVFSAQLTKMGETDDLTFTGAIGQRIYLDKITPTSVQSGMYCQLFSPTGATAVGYRAFNDVETFTLTESGTYTLRLYGTVDNLNYSLRVIDNTSISSTAISLDTTYSAQLTKMGESDDLTFTGAIGQKIYLNKLTPLAVSSGMFCQLFSPTGATTISYRPFNDVDTFTLTESGTYTLRLYGTVDNLDYSLQVLEVPPTETTAIDFNTVYSGAISVPGESDEYTFIGEAGQKFYYRDPVGVTTQSRLVGPGGTVFNSTAGSWEGVLTQAGLYTLTIDANVDAIPSYDFAFYEQLAVPPIPVVFGQTIDGTIGIPGERDRYSFTATSGQQLSFETMIGNVFNHDWQLFSPTGVAVFPAATWMNRGPLTLVAGEYILEVDGKEAATAAYRFRINEVAPPVTDNIVLGELIEDTIAASGEVHQYRFTATAGQYVFFDRHTGSGAMQVKLDGPAGQVFTQSSFTERDTVQLTSSGEYVLTLTPNVGNTGNFSFTLHDVPPPTPVAISRGQVVQGNIATPGEEHRYTFSGHTGDRLFLDVQEKGGLWAVAFKVLSSNGSTVLTNSSEDRSLFTLPADDTYTIVVGELTLLDTVGKYRFLLNAVPEDLSLPAEWQTNYSDLIVAGQSLTYTFSATAGQGLLLDLRTNPGGVPFKLLGPNSEVVFTNKSKGQWVNALPATGTYSLIIGGSANDHAGPVVFRLQDTATPDIGVQDTMGTEFWMAFPNIARPFGDESVTSEQAVYISSAVATSGTVSVPGKDWYTSFSIQAGQSLRIVLPAETEILYTGLEVTSMRGVHVTSLAEIAVYATNFISANSDAIQAYPVDSLGTDYLALGYWNNGFGFAQFLNSSHFVVVATTDNTTVTITPTNTIGARTAGVPYNISLDAGESYQLTNTSRPGDLSGSSITSNHPIAVFGGNGSSIVPNDTPSANTLLEQLPSVETWGRRFMTVPFATRLAGDVFRIMAGHDDTEVSIDGVVVATLNRGQIFDTVLTAASEITATNGVLVAQISKSTTADFVFNADPFYTLVPAVDQFHTQHVFTTPAIGYLDHYMNLVVPAAAVGQVLLDGLPIASGSFTAIGVTGFSQAQLLLSPGQHEVTSTYGTGVTAYGYGVQDGYGYIAGASMAPLSEVTTLELTPGTSTVAFGSPHSVTATVLDNLGNPIAGVLVNFTVTGGTPAGGSAITNALGQAVFTFTGTALGTSNITATVSDISDNASVTWSDSAPVITVESPAPGSELVVGDSYLLTGQALPGTPLGSIVDVTVNGLSVEALDQAGRFFIRVPIALGVNSFTISATRADGTTGTTAVSYDGIAAPSPGIDLNVLNDSTGVANLTSQGTFYNRYTHQLHSAVRITNQGDDPLRGPVVALVDRLRPGSVQLLATPDGLASDGRQQVIFDTEFSGTLAPGASTSGVWVTFDVPAEERFTLDVTLLSPRNRAPTVESVPQLEAVVGVGYSHVVAGADTDGDTLAYRLIAAPEGMVINSTTGLIEWTPLLAQAGSQQVEVEVTDSRGGSIRQRFTIQARNNPDNRAPIFQSAPLTQVSSSASYEYQPAAFDLDGDNLTWSLDQSPGSMSINTATGAVTWASATTGNHPITIKADDGNGGIAYQSFVLSVGSVSTNLGAPILRSTPPITAAVDVLYAYQVWADDPEGGALTYSLAQKPTGMNIDVNGRITWTPTSGQTGSHVIEVVVDDGAGGLASAIYTIVVTDPLSNRIPLFTSQPTLFATQNAAYQYHVTAADPEGQTVTLTLISGTPGMNFDSATGILTWTPSITGTQLVRFRAQDSTGGTAWQTFLVDVREPNVAPWISSTPVTSVTAGTVYRYDVEATDAADGFSFSLVGPPTGMQIDSHTGLIWWLPTTGDLGAHTMLVRVTDDRGAVREQSFTLTVTNDVTAPTVNLVRSAEAVNVSEPVELKIFATDNRGVSSVTLTMNGVPITLNPQNEATFTPTATGFYTILATATDAASNVGTTSFRLRVIDPADVTAPTISLTSPSANTLVSYLTDLVGTINDAHLDYWRVEYALLDTDEFYPLAEGTSNVAANTIATFDPTVLQNDQYIVRITASDLSGNTSTLERALEVTGEAKLGHFRQEFTDLTIPLAGIPITISRIYDTLAANESGDFGYGWSLGMREANIRETVRQNPLEPLAGLFATTAFREGTRVYLNAPDGRRIGFTFTPTVQSGMLGDLYTPKFTADPGVFETLTVDDMALSKFPDGTFHLYFSAFNYNPSQYTLTARDQTVYRYDQFEGLQDVTDRNGNQLVYTDAGIFHSSGESIQFIRDEQGRIKEIVDPAGNSLYYTYDGRGDLVEFRNQENLGTNFDYYDEPAHYLKEVTSDCGCTSYFRTEYDDDGRIIAIYDANGVPAAMSYDLENNTEIVGDREGNESILTYDDRGNIISVTDPMGATTSYTFDASNNQTSITDGRGFTTTHTFDSRGNVTSLTDPNNNTWTFSYNTSNDITQIIDSLGRSETYVYDTNGNLINYTDKNNKSIVITVDSLGRTTGYMDRTGKTTTFTYNGDGGQPVRITNDDSSYRELVYNLLGLPLVTTDEEGRETTFSYDATGRPLTIRDAKNGLITFAYSDKNVDHVVDELGRITRYEYDDAGQRTKIIDALGGVTSFQYDANGAILSTTDPLGETTTYVYRSDGLLELVTDSLGGSTRFQYDAAKNQTGVIDANGHATTFEYDNRNLLTKATNALGGTRVYTYDAVGNLKSQRDENGNLTRYNYNALDQLVEQINALNYSALWTYDAEGNVTTYTDETNHTTSLVYNSRYWVTSITDPAGKVRSFDYDLVGNQTSTTDEMLRTTSYAFDDLNRLVSVTEPLNAVTTYEYDAVGNILSYTDPLLQTTTSNYDDLNRLIDTTDPRGAVTTYTYDADSNLRSLTDSIGNKTRFNYDALDRLVEEVDPLGRSRTYNYDAVGNLTRRVDRNGRVIEYSFDNLDRVSAERWLTGGDVVRTFEFVYDAASNLMDASDLDSSYSYTYDALNRIVTSNNSGTPGAPSVTLTSSYDAAGRRTGVIDNSGVAVNSTYNTRGLLERRTWHGGGIDAAMLDFTYNNAGERVEINRYSDITGTTSIGRTTFDYDDQGRLNDIVHLDALDSVMADYDFLYDLADQLTSSAHHGETTTYVHDDSGQLTGANHSVQSDETYSYDLNGNRTTVGMVTGPNNQVLSDGTYAYAYDGEGNLLTKTETSTGNVISYIYDHRNRLTSVVTTNSSNVVILQTTFTYDVFDRRISKSVDLDGAGPTTAEETHFVYDGEHIWADYDESGTVLTRYLFGDNVDEVLARYDSTDGTAWYLTDNLGTVRDIVDADGDLLNHIDYDSFGQIIAQSNAAAGDRFTYTGREWDSEIGLYYYRARYYDPQLGKFISVDPIGFAAGDASRQRSSRSPHRLGQIPVHDGSGLRVGSNRHGGW